MHYRFEVGPLVSIAQLTGFEGDAVDLEGEAVHRAGAGDVGTDGHTLRLQGADELLHGLRTGGQGGVQHLLQLQPRWRDAGAQRGFDLAFLHRLAFREDDRAVFRVVGAAGDGETVLAF